MIISFTQALLAFTIIQILLYLLILVVIDRRADISARESFVYKGSHALIGFLDKISFIISVVGLILTLLMNFRETLPYFMILSLTLFINTLYVILKGSSGYVLGSFILWHLMMYLNTAPAIDVSVGEGSVMVRETRLNDHWDFKWAHNPSYNPIPTVASIQATLSRMTTMNWYSYNLRSVVFIDPQPREIYLKMLSEARYAINPGRHETHSIFIAEALAIGTPSIITREIAENIEAETKSFNKELVITERAHINTWNEIILKYMESLYY